jgi:hypothetical protein
MIKVDVARARTRKKPPGLATRGLNPPKEEVEETTSARRKTLMLGASIATLCCDATWSKVSA